MPHSFSDAEIQRHNRLCAEADALAEGELYFGVNSPGDPDDATAAKLRRAAYLFQQALDIHCDNESAMFMIGKIYQRLDEDIEALTWFVRAFRVNGTNADAAREAGIAATDLGDAPLAVEMCQAAVALDPQEPGLIANLALAYLIAGDLDLAAAAAQHRLLRAPKDAISHEVARVISEVRTGRRPQPKSMRDLQ